MITTLRKELDINLERVASILSASPSTIRMSSRGERVLPEESSNKLIQMLNLLSEVKPVYSPDEADEELMAWTLNNEKDRLSRSIAVGEIRLDKLEKKFSSMEKDHEIYKQSLANANLLLRQEDQSDPLSAYAPLLLTRRELFKKYLATNATAREKVRVDFEVLKLKIEMEKEMLLSL